jgi:hypothetical protein
MPRKGWSRLPGSAERYLSPDGEEVSRRQYDNLRAQEQGWQTRSAYERRYDDPTYLWAWNTWRQENKVQIVEARRLDRMGGQLNKKLRAAQATGWGKTKQGRDPKGPMSQLLIEMGMRDPTATYAVGNTDARR